MNQDAIGVPERPRTPSPFIEKIATYNVKIGADHVFVGPKPNKPGVLAL